MLLGFRSGGSKRWLGDGSGMEVVQKLEMLEVIKILDHLQPQSNKTHERRVATLMTWTIIIVSQ